MESLHVQRLLKGTDGWMPSCPSCPGCSGGPGCPGCPGWLSRLSRLSWLSWLSWLVVLIVPVVLFVPVLLVVLVVPVVLLSLLSLLSLLAKGGGRNYLRFLWKDRTFNTGLFRICVRHLIIPIPEKVIPLCTIYNTSLIGFVMFFTGCVRTPFLHKYSSFIHQ